MSPLAAFLSNRLAKRRGYDTDRYTVYGAVWSALLLLPAIWLVLKLKGVSLPRGIVGLGYGIIYTGWFVSGKLSQLYYGFGQSSSTTQPQTIGLAMIVTGLAGGALWCLSICQLTKTQFSDDDLINFRRIKPSVSAPIAGSYMFSGFVNDGWLPWPGSSVVVWVVLTPIVAGWTVNRFTDVGRLDREAQAAADAEVSRHRW